MKHLNLPLERLLAQCDCTRILRVLAFVEADLKGTLMATLAAAVNIRDALVLLVSDPD